MAEIVYEAQQFFPPKCRTCPWLVGLIEDGLISPNEVSSAEVMDGIREHCRDVNFEACDGPDETIDNEQLITTCTSL